MSLGLGRATSGGCGARTLRAAIGVAATGAVRLAVEAALVGRALAGAIGFTRARARSLRGCRALAVAGYLQFPRTCRFEIDGGALRGTPAGYLDLALGVGPNIDVATSLDAGVGGLGESKREKPCCGNGRSEQ